MLKICRACDSVQLQPLWESDPLPLTHRFPTTKEEVEPRHALKLGVCLHCELVQWVECPPRSTFLEDSTFYREPEFHLDTIANQLESLPLSDGYRIGMLSEKDRSLAERLKRGKLVDRAPYDLLLSRHYAEHADSLSSWFGAWRESLSPQGFLYLEVPDASPALSRGDVTVLWEQHQIYFSEMTLRRALATQGFGARALALPTTDSRSEGILAVLADPRQPTLLPPSGRDEDEARAFPLRVARQKKAWEELLRGKKVSALGVGHDLITFLHAHRLTSHLEFVTDDSPGKLGRFLPGTSIPILPVNAIRKSRTELCLLGVMAEAEDKILERLADFRREGGEVFSIYSLSKLAPRSICQSDLRPLSLA